MADLGLGDALDLAMEKIVGAGGKAVRAGVEHGRGRILVDAQQWMRSADPVPLLPEIHDGVSRARRLLLDYVDSEDRRRQVLVDPLGSWRKPGSGTSWPSRGPTMTPVEPAEGPVAFGCRLFRVARVRSCEVTPPWPTSPAAADLEEVWTALRSKTEERRRDLPVRSAVSPAALPMVRRLLAGRVVEGGAPSPLPEGFGDAGPAPGELRGHPARRRRGLRPADTVEGRESPPATSGWRSGTPLRIWLTCTTRRRPREYGRHPRAAGAAP